MPVTRLIEQGDAEALAALLTANREFLEPWEPEHDESFFTLARQRAVIRRHLEEHVRGQTVPFAILDESGDLAGRITLNGVVRGAFQSASVGYWVSRERNGRGLATAAVADVISYAFGPVGLHRLQAETLPHNVRSQRVLARNGFRPFALAPGFLKIEGRWQDHVLFQLLNESC
ncbi:MAG: GNAT family N-acetyltransferase [Streptosporangiales bacterium]|nr:GNAT family N-acetyltransferase [Streptosporangiales bacterium]